MKSSISLANCKHLSAATFNSPPVYVRVGEAAQALGSNVIALYILIEQGRTETVRIGRRALVKTESLLKLVGDAQ